MLVYLSLFIFVVVLRLYSLRNRKNAEFMLFLLLTFGFIMINTLKDISVGSDTERYFNGFVSISSINFRNLFYFPWETGYVFFNKLVSLVGSFTSFTFFVSIINYCVLMFYIRTFSDNPFISYLIYLSLGFFSFSLSGYRQSLALSMSMLMILSLNKDRIILSILFYLIAIAFHQSALILLIFYLFYYKKIKTNYFIFLPMSGVIIYALSDLIIIKLLTFYERSQIVSEGQGFNLFVALLVISFFSAFYYLIKGRDSTRLQFHAIFWAPLLQLISFKLSIFVRVVSYLYFQILVVVPNMIDNITDKKQRIFIEYIVIICLFIIYYIGLSNNNYSIVPYKMK